MISNIFLIILNLNNFCKLCQKILQIEFFNYLKKKNPIKNHLYNNFNKIMESNDN